MSMINDSQLQKIKEIVAKTAFEAKTVNLIDSTLIQIKEELGRDYTVAYTLPSDWTKKDLGCVIKFMVLENVTGKVYEFSVIPRAEVLIDTMVEYPRY